MSEDKQLPEVFTHASHVIAAARMGMRMKAIAARANMRKRDFDVFLEANEDVAIKLEQAYADYEEDKRKRIDEVEQMAIKNEDASLIYKINREAIKELVDRDNATRVMQVVVNEGQGLVEPDYEDLSQEELDAIRAKTESEANKDGQ